MGAPRKYTRNQPQQPPSPSSKSLWRDARHVLLRWEHTNERLQEQARLILAGQKGDTERVIELIAVRDIWWAQLLPILTELAQRTRLAKKKRLPHDSEHEWLTTAAQAIARAATQQDFNL